MKSIVLIIGMLVGVVAIADPAQQYGTLNDREKGMIRTALESQLSRDMGYTVRANIVSTEVYISNNRNTNVRGRAQINGQRRGPSEVIYDCVMDSRRNRVISITYNRDLLEPNQGVFRPLPGSGVQSGSLPNGRYEIQLVATQRSLSVGGNGVVVQGQGRGARSAQWDIENAGNGSYYIRSAETGEYMTYEGGGRSGSSVVLGRQGRQFQQQTWQIIPGPDNGYYVLAANGLSMDSPSSARYDGGRMQLYNRNGEANQRFWMRQIGGTGGNWRDRPGRDVPNWNRGTNSGRASWSGRIDGLVELEISGNRVYARAITGQPPIDPRSRMDGAIPRSNVNIQVTKVRGRGRVDVIQQPSASNNYRAIIRIDDNKGGDDDYELDITWN